MGVNVHLVLLMLTILGIAIVLVVDDGRPDRRLREILSGATPVLFIGLLCSLLLLAGGKPLLEWLLPLTGVLLIGWRCRSDRVFQVAKWAAPVVAIALVLHFLAVAHQAGVTNAPDLLSRLSKQRESIALQKASDSLRTAFDSATEFPAGPIRSILPDVDAAADVVELQRIRPQWHSVFSHLYRVEHLRGTVWYPGGDVAKASQNLEVRVPADEAP